MADFTPRTAVKSAVRNLSAPIETLSGIGTVVNTILMDNPFECTAYQSGGENRSAVEKTKEYYSGSIVYENNEGKKVGSISVNAPTLSGFNTSITPLGDCAHMPATRTGDEISGSPSPGPDTKGRIPVTDIDPERFVKVKGFSAGVCDCCGRRSPHYVERTKERGKAGNPSRMVCERCYGKAVTRTVMSISALPGLIAPDRMVREDRELGRCHICNLGRISWWDADLAIGLCSPCFEREKQAYHKSQVVR